MTGGESPEDLALLPLDHPLLAGGAPVWLGYAQGHPVFAAEIAADAPVPAGLIRADLRPAAARLAADAGELAATARALHLWHDSHRFCARCGSPSDMVDAGWQRICPACGAHHFPRTDPVVIMLITAGDRALLGRSPGWPDRMHSLLAGFVEPGETIEAAVRREVAEETGVVVGDVGYVASQPWPFPASLMLGCTGRALSTEIHLDPNELEAALWVGRAEAAVILDQRHPTVGAPRRGAIARVLLEGWVDGRLG
jgi:NAD+ diphosphatase